MQQEAGDAPYPGSSVSAAEFRRTAGGSERKKVFGGVAKGTARCLDACAWLRVGEESGSLGQDAGGAPFNFAKFLGSEGPAVA